MDTGNLTNTNSKNTPDENKACSKNSAKVPLKLNNEMTQTDNVPNMTMTTHQYAEAYRMWMFQHQIFQQINLAYFNIYSMINVFNQNALFFNSKPAIANQPQLDHTQTQQSSSQPRINQSTNPVAERNTPRRNCRQCEIPPLWKRFAAEMIDFFILFILKLAGSIILFDYAEFIDIDSYDLDKFINMTWDSKLANISNELIVFELVNKLFVSLFEAMCLRRGPNGTIGGSTPGKKMMGLRVVSCTDVIKINDKKVLVYPAGDLKFIDSLTRSIVKNFCYIFFIPMPLTALVFLHSRTLYDFITNSMVVYVGDDDARDFRR